MCHCVAAQSIRWVVCDSSENLSALMAIEHFDPGGGGLGGGCAWEILDMPEIFQGCVSLAVFVEVLGDEATLPRLADLVAAVLLVAFLVLAGLLPFVTTSAERAAGSDFSTFALESGVAGFPWSAIRPVQFWLGHRQRTRPRIGSRAERPIEWTWR